MGSKDAGLNTYKRPGPGLALYSLIKDDKVNKKKVNMKRPE